MISCSFALTHFCIDDNIGAQIELVLLKVLIVLQFMEWFSEKLQSNFWRGAGVAERS